MASTSSTSSTASTASTAEPTAEPTEEHETASTSKFEAELDITVDTLVEMIISCKCYEEKVTEDKSKEETDQSTSSNDAPSEPIKDEKRRNSWCFRSGRYTPYLLPRKQKTRSRSLSELDYNAFSKVRWKGDKELDYLRLSILDEKKPTSCGVEAARPPTPDIEIDELSEYFSYFVRVEMKMSALAESMYC